MKPVQIKPPSFFLVFSLLSLLIVSSSCQKWGAHTISTHNGIDQEIRFSVGAGLGADTEHSITLEPFEFGVWDSLMALEGADPERMQIHSIGLWASRLSTTDYYVPELDKLKELSIYLKNPLDRDQLIKIAHSQQVQGSHLVMLLNEAPEVTDILTQKDEIELVLKLEFNEEIQETFSMDLELNASYHGRQE